MKRKLLSLIGLILLVFSIQAQENADIFLILEPEKAEETISRHIYGHFSEHLGRCIYGGYWVGEDSSIPNTNGIRNDVVKALRQIDIPNLRWPGGCFADEYHWKDGIGPKEERPKMVNTHWGGVTEDNSFGTHEFMELCEQLDTEPVICGNVGSGTVHEMSEWVEYLNFGGISPMADLRRKNGREAPWGVKYWGVGNENWGCGGNMTAEFYANQYRRYATYCRDYGDNKLFKIAGGAGGSDFHWTETLMKEVPHGMMDGLSLHYYTVNWSDKGSATEFGEKLYFDVLKRCLDIEDAMDRHISIMDKFDPEKNVALVFDEWGTWYDVEPGTNPGFLFQQNTMRDALVAALTLNYLNERCARVKMANIAQTVNVLQALIFTDEEKMIVTPTYHVYDLYKVHHDARLIPVSFNKPQYSIDSEQKSLNAVSITASKDDQENINISMVNIHPEEKYSITLNQQIDKKKVSGKILRTEAMNSHNTFEYPDNVQTEEFSSFTVNNGELSIDLPPMSIVVMKIEK